MDYIRKHNERGSADFGWLQSQHSFSFGRYYDPAHMGFSVLRVINDDKVAPGAGFDTHPHQNMEIISVITEGTIAHRDSMGNEYRIPAGDVQVMSAGTGVTHSEFNASDTDPLSFLQIWILPSKQNVAPAYHQKTVRQNSDVELLVSPDGRDGSLPINQQAFIHRISLKSGQIYPLWTQQSAGYLHIVSGQVDIEGQDFGQGDGIGFQPNRQATLRVTSKTFSALWFDLPAD